MGNWQVSAGILIRGLASYLVSNLVVIYRKEKLPSHLGAPEFPNGYMASGFSRVVGISSHDNGLGALAYEEHQVMAS